MIYRSDTQRFVTLGKKIIAIVRSKNLLNWTYEASKAKMKVYCEKVGHA